jgi:hypothetical protein
MTSKNTGTESGSSSNQQGGQETQGGKSGHAGQSGKGRAQQPQPSGDKKSGGQT